MLIKTSIHRIGALALILALIGVPSRLTAQGGGEDAFLTFPLGARAIGMGRAYTGISDDIQSIVWNPAGIALLDRMEVSYSRLESFKFEGLNGTSGINDNLISLGFPTEKYGSFGLSLEIQNYGETVLTDDSGNLLGVQNDRGYIFYGTYATSIFDKLDIGLDFKYLRVSFAGLEGTQRRGSTSAIDIGGLYRPLRNVPLQLGVAFRNLGFALQFEDEYQKDPLPRRLVIGAGYDLLQHLIGSDQLSLLISTDVKLRRVNYTDEEGRRITNIQSYNYFGTEFGFNRMLFLRAGYIAEPKEFHTSGGTFGIGLNYGGIMFDLAREVNVSELGDETHVTAGYHF